MEKQELPAWLETLWNVNPRLAEAAEKDVERWQKLETNQALKLDVNIRDVKEVRQYLMTHSKTIKGRKALATVINIIEYLESVSNNEADLDYDCDITVNVPFKSTKTFKLMDMKKKCKNRP